MENYQDNITSDTLMITNILQIGDIVDHIVSDELKKFEITPGQFKILLLLDTIHPGKLSISDISDSLFDSTSDVSRIIDRLVKRKLITRNICPKNRRKMDVCINIEGIKIISQALPGIKYRMEGFYRNRISIEETDLLERIFDKLNTNRDLI